VSLWHNNIAYGKSKEPATGIDDSNMQLKKYTSHLINKYLAAKKSNPFYNPLKPYF
jgi:hypothetical protein